MVYSFERLPDKAAMPDYYTEIKNPMALDVIKKKLKRKKYNAVDPFMKDIELMFENAKLYNTDESQVYQDAVFLQKETRSIAEMVKQKPDTDFASEDGRIPMPDGILHNGELWKVGKFRNFSSLVFCIDGNQATGYTSKMRMILPNQWWLNCTAHGKTLKATNGSTRAGTIDLSRLFTASIAISTRTRSSKQASIVIILSMRWSTAASSCSSRDTTRVALVTSQLTRKSMSARRVTMRRSTS
jgi:hypothetical protein